MSPPRPSTLTLPGSPAPTDLRGEMMLSRRDLLAFFLGRRVTSPERGPAEEVGRCRKKPGAVRETSRYQTSVGLLIVFGTASNCWLQWCVWLELHLMRDGRFLISIRTVCRFCSGLRFDVWRHADVSENSAGSVTVAKSKYKVDAPNEVLLGTR
ncbi:hypothetical protein VTG60DRAFT_4516 [Thermothelomyces hinnuleus]